MEINDAIAKVEKVKLSLMDKHGKECECVALQTAIDFLSRYTAISESGGWPGEKDCPAQFHNEWCDCEEVDGYNQARREMLMCLMGKLEGLEETINSWVDKHKQFRMSLHLWGQSLAQAITDYLMGTPIDKEEK